MQTTPVRLVQMFAVLVSFTCGISLSTHAQQLALEKNTGSISGRVMVDGKPKAGLTVELRATAPTGERRLIAKAVTNETGKYLLTGVAPGTYDVSPSAPTLVIPNEGKSGEPGRTVTIEMAEQVKGIDFDLISKGTISGRVRNIIGEPVKGQTVELIRRGEDNYSRSFQSEKFTEHITNDDGAYRISGVPPGRYLVKVGIDYGVADEWTSRRDRIYYPQTFHPDANEASKATIVEITTGKEATEVDITVGSPLKLYEIVGQLVDARTGAPVPNVGLKLTTTSKDGRHSTHGGGGSSDANGEFRIKNAMPGRYVIAPENDRASNTYGDSIAVDVRDADVGGLKIPMHSASTLTGTVSVEGNIDFPVADLLSKLMISAHALSTDLMNSTVSSPVSPDGAFRIAGVRPGKVRLSSRLGSFGPQGFSLIRIERNGVEVRNGVDVGVGQDVTGLRLVMAAGSSVLKGEVRIEGGPLEGVILYVMCRPTNGNPSGFSAELDTRGRFVIKNLIPGEYELMIGPMSVYTTGDKGSRTMGRMPTVKQNVVVGPGVDAEVTLVLSLRPEPPARPQP